MEKEFKLEEERKKIPKIVNITDATAYKEGVKNALEIVKIQDEEFIKRLKESEIDYTTSRRRWLCSIIDKLLGGKNEKKKI